MSSTPEERFDEWFREDHKNTGKAVWELNDDDTSIEEPEFEDNGT